MESFVRVDGLAAQDGVLGVAMLGGATWVVDLRKVSAVAVRLRGEGRQRMSQVR